MLVNTIKGIEQNIQKANFVFGPCSIIVSLFVLLFIGACAPLKPVQLPDEYTSASSEAMLWQRKEAIRSDNWFVLLNDGKSAFDWRLTAIDSAVENIDLQTFLWDFDTAGSVILDRDLMADGAELHEVRVDARDRHLYMFTPTD
jgi:hypothetical protein